MKSVKRESSKHKASTSTFAIFNYLKDEIEELKLLQKEPEYAQKIADAFEKITSNEYIDPAELFLLGIQWAGIVGKKNSSKPRPEQLSEAAQILQTQKSDEKVKNTIEKIKDSMKYWKEKRPGQKPTMNEIAKKAGVSRSTVYNHADVCGLVVNGKNP